MNNSKLWLTAALLLLVGCSAPGASSQSKTSGTAVTSPRPETVLAESTEVEPSIPVVQIDGNTATDRGWEISAKIIPAGQQTFEGEYQTYEAAKVWTVVEVTLKNVSDERKQEGESPFFFFKSSLVDSNGTEYSIEQEEYQSDIERIRKPFTPGEARVTYFLFDTPNGTIPNNLIMARSIQEKSIALKLSN